MDWELCQKEHLRKIEPDKEKIKSILKMCSVRLRLAQKQEIDDETASIITENYYEIIKELLTALLLKNTLKSDNHECLISFFKKNYSRYEYEIGLIHELKGIRNKISYEGVFVEKEYLIKNKLEFEHIINLITKLIGGEK
ncbi:MAG: hypothetical protein KAT77_00055 [Nanoarchaeota archaeon]|nr:hypothetical protein [Nanoarchaeota archaeon]